jgi:hypothetical protein
MEIAASSAAAASSSSSAPIAPPVPTDALASFFRAPDVSAENMAAFAERFVRDFA